jgi:hypothetical protein
MGRFIWGMFVGFSLTAMLSPPTRTTKFVWNEAERICFAEGADAGLIQEGTFTQHKVICDNGRVYRFSSRESK